jgi:DNA polymerase-3 subunit alpha
MDIFRDYINKNKSTLLRKLNDIVFLENWNKYAKGNYSSWEMEVLCFYYHKHELYHVNADKYGYVNFFNMPEEPVIESTWKKNGKTINKFKLSMICGTCIAKNKPKAIVTLLTPQGVVNVKFRKEYFSLFDKQISERQPDGSKKVIEKSWFNRGSMIAVQGMRSGDNFIVKKYASSLNQHQLYKITSIDKDGNIILQSERYSGGFAEDEEI